MVATDLLIGSYPNLEAQTMSVTTAGPVTEDCTLAAGSYYLYDDLSAFDLIDTLGDVLETHSVLNDVEFRLQENGKLRVTSTIAFTLTWPTDNILRNLLGFAGNLTPSAMSFTATLVSPLLWAPGKNKNPTEARRDTNGIPVRDIAVGQSGPGTVVATSHNRYRRNTLIYRYIANSKVWTTAEAGGEFFTFFDQVLAERRRFKVWREFPEGTGTTLVTPSDTGTELPSTGAYIYTGPNEMPWGREFGQSESRHPITIPVVTAAEYT